MGRRGAHTLISLFLFFSFLFSLFSFLFSLFFFSKVVEGRINKYGTAEEKKRFSEWTKCYGKSTSKMLVDKSKRKFFYCPSQYEEGNKKGQNVNVGNRAAPKLAWGGSSGGGVMSGGGVISRGGVISGGGGAAFGPASFPVGYREGERERSGEEKEGFPPAVELMVLVHECFKRGLLTPEEKNVVKKTIFQDLQAFVDFDFYIFPFL